MSRKVALWIVVAVVGTLLVLTILAAAGSRTEPLRKLVVATLEDRLDSNVELDSFSVDLFPAVTVRGAGLKIRLRRITDPSIPPLIVIDSFTVHCGIIDLLRRPRRFKHVTLDKLVVNIPPGGLKGARQGQRQIRAAPRRVDRTALGGTTADTATAEQSRTQGQPRRITRSSSMS